MSPAMRTATRYARYLYSTLEPWLRWPVLEIGTGFGTYTRMLLDGGPVFSVDVDADCLRDVRASHAGNPLSTIQLDLNDHAAVRDLARVRFCSIFSTNVFEHLADDAGCLRALYDASESGCRICLLVPAHPGLYGYMDRDAGHYRRYTRRSLTDAMAGVGWRVHRTFYLNALGGLGWLVNHRLLPPRPLDSTRVDGQLRLYDRWMVPVARWTDPLFRRFCGLSVAALAEKE